MQKGPINDKKQILNGKMLQKNLYFIKNKKKGMKEGGNQAGGKREGQGDGKRAGGTETERWICRRRGGGLRGVARGM